MNAGTQRSPKPSVQVVGGQATPALVAQAEAWAARNAEGAWMRATGSSPDAISWWTEE